MFIIFNITANISRTLNVTIGTTAGDLFHPIPSPTLRRRTDVTFNKNSNASMQSRENNFIEQIASSMSPGSVARARAPTALQWISANILHCENLCLLFPHDRPASRVDAFFRKSFRQVTHKHSSRLIDKNWSYRLTTWRVAFAFPPLLLYKGVFYFTFLCSFFFFCFFFYDDPSDRRDRLSNARIDICFAIKWRVGCVPRADNAGDIGSGIGVVCRELAVVHAKYRPLRPAESRGPRR